MCRHCRHHPYIDSSCLDRLTYSESVDDCCHHPHLISDHPIKSTLLELYTSEYITTTDDDRDLEFTNLYEVYDFFCYIGKEFWIDPVSLFSLEGFTRELEEDSFGSVILFHTLSERLLPNNTNITENQRTRINSITSVMIAELRLPTSFSSEIIFLLKVSVS